MKSPYQTIRESIMVNGGFTMEDVRNKKVPWNRIRNQLNDTVEDNLHNFWLDTAKRKKYSLDFESEVFKKAILSKNDGQFDERKEKCNLTKNKSLINLFEYLDIERPNDFFPKTKDFFAVYMNYSAWRIFLGENKEDPAPEDEPIYGGAAESLELLQKYIHQKFKDVSDYSTSIRDLFEIQDEIYKSLDKLVECEESLDEYIPNKAENEQRKRFFTRIINAKKLSVSHRILIDTFITNSENKIQDSSFVASVLTISNLKFHDIEKISYLATIVREGCSKPKLNDWQKALVGLILGLLKIYNDKAKVLEFKRKISGVENLEQVRNSIYHIVSHLIDLDFNSDCEEILDHNFFDEPHRCITPFTKDSHVLKESFELNQLNINTETFSQLLSESWILTTFDKYKISFSYREMEEEDAEEFMKYYEDAAKKHRRFHYFYFEENISFFYLNILFELNCVLRKFKNNLNIAFPDLPSSKKERQNFLSVLSETFREYTSIGEFYAKELKDYKTAMKYFKKGKEVQRDHFNLLKLTGKYSREAGKLQKALKYHRKAREMIYEDFPNNILTAHCFIQLENFDEAYECLLWALDIEPDNAWVLNQFGLCLEEEGNLKEAFEYYEKAYEIEVEASLKKFIDGNIFHEEKDYKRAMECYLFAEELTPKNIRLLFQIAELHKDQGDIEQAIKYYLRVEKLQAKNVRNLKSISDCYQEMGFSKKSVFYTEKVQKLVDEGYDEQNNDDFNGEYINIERKLQYHKRAEVNHPNNVWNIENIGFYLSQKGDFEEAIKYYLRTIELAPSDYYSLALIGYCLQGLGKYKEGIEYHYKVEMKDPKYVWNLQQIIICLEALNDNDTAREYYQKIERINP